MPEPSPINVESEAGVAKHITPSSHTFRLASLPLEIQLRIFRLLISKADADEDDVERTARRQTRTNLLLADRATYRNLAPEFYRAATIRLESPWMFIGGFIHEANKLCTHNIRHIEWKLDMTGYSLSCSASMGLLSPLYIPSSIGLHIKALFSALPGLKESKITWILSISTFHTQIPGGFPESCEAWWEWLSSHKGTYLAEARAGLESSFPMAQLIPYVERSYYEPHTHQKTEIKTGNKPPSYANWVTTPSISVTIVPR